MPTRLRISETETVKRVSKSWHQRRRISVEQELHENNSMTGLTRRCSQKDICMSCEVRLIRRRDNGHLRMTQRQLCGLARHTSSGITDQDAVGAGLIGFDAV